MIAMSSKEGSWKIPVVKVTGFKEPKKFSQDVEEVYNKIEEHHKYLVESNLLSSRIRRKAAAELNEALWAKILQPVLDDLNSSGEIEKLVDKLVSRDTDPYTAAEKVARKYMK